MLKFAVFAAVVGLCCGCSSGPKSPDVKESIEKSLRDAGLKDVSVSQDREKGVVTLGGHVNSQEDKTRAESAAQRASRRSSGGERDRHPAARFCEHRQRSQRGSGRSH